MTKEAIGAPGAGAQVPLSKAMRAGEFVFVSGQVPFGADGQIVSGSIEVQTKQVMENIKGVLEQAGCTMDDIVKCTVWLSDTGDFGGFNRVYSSYFSAEPPARSAVRSDLMIDARVEVEAIAYKP